MVATRDLTGSIRTTVRRKKVRVRRAAATRRAAGDVAPFHIQAIPSRPAAVLPQ